MAAVSSVLRSVVDADGNKGLAHYCPGCRCAHIFWIGPKERPVWTFDGNLEKPTFSPSMRSFVPAGPEYKTPEVTLCHYYLTAGVINYLSDSSHHALRGPTPLPPFPGDYCLE